MIIKSFLLFAIIFYSAYIMSMDQTITIKNNTNIIITDTDNDPIQPDQMYVITTSSESVSPTSTRHGFHVWRSEITTKGLHVITILNDLSNNDIAIIRKHTDADNDDSSNDELSSDDSSNDESSKNNGCVLN